jgi:hypothetical protein
MKRRGAAQAPHRLHEKGNISMNLLPLAALIAAPLLLASAPALLAQDQENDPDTLEEQGVPAPQQPEAVPAPFERLLLPDSPQCIARDQLRGTDATIELTPEQFQFVRALFVAIPPVSHQLPPGDRAIMASSKGKVLVALVSGDKLCARFLAPQYVTDMIIKVGEGEIAQPGTRS